jgi:hypothetical protein
VEFISLALEVVAAVVDWRKRPFFLKHWRLFLVVHGEGLLVLWAGLSGLGFTGSPSSPQLGAQAVTFGAAIPKDNGFEFDAHSVRDWNHRARLEYKCGQHGAKLMNGGRIIAIQHHVATPVAHSDHEQLYFEIGWSLPLSENLQNALLGILIFDR